MKVILLQNIKGFGQIGDIKSVSDGHARNFLFPRKLAKVADNNALKEVETLKKQREASLVKDLEEAKKAAVTLAGVTLEFSKKASPTGTLFSSVTRHEIAHELAKKTGIKVATDSINLPEQSEHIKHLGEHTAKIELAGGLNADLKIEIKPEN